MHRLQNMDPCEIVNVSCESGTDFLEEAGELTHLIGVLTTKNDISSNLDTFPVKAYSWAVFPNEGRFPFTLQDTMARIYSEWLVTADYKLAESLSFSFTKMDEIKPDYAYSEIWIPKKGVGNYIQLAKPVNDHLAPICRIRNYGGNRICGYVQNAEENLKEQIRVIIVGKRPKQYQNI